MAINTMTIMDEKNTTPAAEIEFTTLGLFIIDQIHFQSTTSTPARVVDDIIGGAGTYAILGARLFSPPPLSRNLGWIIDAGTDFPPSLACTFNTWQTHLLLRRTPSRLTTRSWNAYGPGDHRAFRYLTPKLRLGMKDLQECKLADSKVVHIICAPERADVILRELAAAGEGGEQKKKQKKQKVIWEPVPDLCVPAQKAGMLQRLQDVDVISPNASELAGFFGVECAAVAEEPATVLAHAREIVGAGVGRDGSGAVVVRNGAQGCLVATRDGYRWLHAFHRPSEDGSSSEKVVDPTGGGNAFIGGFGVGIARGVDFVGAAAMGSVASSFVIEQIGVPTLEEGERWNGVDVEERLREYWEWEGGHGAGWQRW